MTSTTYRVAELAATGISQSEIARRLGVSPQRVSHIAKRRGLPSRVENLKQRLRNERQGMSHTAAAERLGVSVSVIGKWNADLPKGFLVDGRAHGTGGRKSGEGCKRGASLGKHQRLPLKESRRATPQDG